MVLLTGRYDYYEIRGGGSFGYAYTGEICELISASMISARADENGNPTQVMYQILAHEFGHLLGSNHDGGKALGDNEGMFPNDNVPCWTGEYLMHGSVDSSMKTWSTCTRQMIDA